MTRPIPLPLLPIGTKDPFQSDLLRALTTFHQDLVGQLNSQVQGLGQTLTSGGTIYVNAAMHHVTGDRVITTIDCPRDFTGPVWLFADDEWTLEIGGNIGSAAAPKANTALMVVYDGSTWYPAS
ncbi:hypothetical protein UFOVP1287_51 [uncultured Caudovirales phage]|uniref:Uncharacterized protein n=1 Tax=uncultured Caudovirales phage TaxID=2100421 RepID=A0A6J5REZ2_9CAUD|nr:hypothetical protein UFOVP1287_51 [uncultured Caudovirales phage]CAB4205306.1 hypothetical protein UFOVP1408_62 [uncultured Caudovirales phage]